MAQHTALRSPTVKIASLFLFGIALLTGAVGQRLNDTAGTFIDFSSIDAYVRKLPRFDSLKLLARNLATVAKSDWEKARAIYVWVCENIEYDTEEFFTGTSAAADQGAFRSGKAVCDGYSDMVTELASSLGLEAIKISGYSKGYGYSEKTKFTNTDHAWNALKIQGKWRLVDTTWGAGAIDDDRHYKKSFTGTWFAMDPDLFLMTHYPESWERSLVANKMSLERFAALPFIQPYVFENIYDAGLSVSEQKLLLAAYPRILNDQIWRVEEMRKAGVGGTENFLVFKRFNELSDKDFWKTIHMVERGYTIPELLSIPKLPLSDEEYSNIALLEKYGFRKSELLKSMESGTFPTAFSAPELMRAVDMPASGTLELGKSYRFSLSINNAEKVAIICDKTFSQMDFRNGIFIAEIRIAAGPVAIVARFPGQKENSYSYLLEYQVR
jgi:hypothetical protein